VINDKKPLRYIARVTELPTPGPSATMPDSAVYPPRFVGGQERALREETEVLRALLAQKGREALSPPEPAASAGQLADETKELFSEKALLALFDRLKGDPSVRNRDIAKETAEGHFGVTIEVKQIRQALADAGIKGKPGAPKGPRNKSGK
jgi:hypothetical protein